MARITGNKAVSGRLQRMSGREKVELVGKALFVGGDEIKAYAKVSITSGSRSGRLVRGRVRKQYVASAPGEPPTYDSQILQSSIEVHQVAPLRVQVTAQAPYAAALEFGTSKMEARPFMGPAARAKRKRVTELVGKSVSIVTRRG